MFSGDSLLFFLTFSGGSMRKDNPVINFDKIISNTIVGLIFIDVMLQVISRILPGNAISWTLEVGEILLAALIWMGVGPGIANNSHVRFDLILMKLKRSWRKPVYIIGNMIFTLFLIVMAVLIVQLLIFYSQSNTRTTLLEVNKMYVRLPMLIGCAVGVVRLVVQSWGFMKGTLRLPIDEAFTTGEGDK